MATTVFSDVLCFMNKSFKRFDKCTLLETIAKFYHEDELYAAKVELCKYVTALQASATDPAPPTIDGWTKMVNVKGVPIVRKSSEPAQRRRHEAEDLIQMLTLLDVHNVTLPRFAAVDIDRVPGAIMIVNGTTGSSLSDVTNLATTMNEMITKFATAMNVVTQCAQNFDKVLRRLDDLESKLLSLPRTGLNTSAVANHVSASSSSSLSASTSSSSGENGKSDGSDIAGASGGQRSWADQVQELADAAPKMTFSNRKTVVRVRGLASHSTIKAVRRPLTCFVGRLHRDVTDDELAAYLKDNGILDAKCVKLVPKDGRVFSTSAFRVSCSSEFESLFYDESLWPIGAELRDWVFRNKDGRQ